MNFFFHSRKEHWYYGSFVIGFTFLPFVFSMVAYLLSDKKTPEGHRKGNVIESCFAKWNFLWQIPFVQLARHFILWMEFKSTVLKEYRIKKISAIDDVEFSSQLKMKQQWYVEVVQEELKKTDMSNEAINFWVDKWKSRHGENCFEGSAYNEIKNLRQESIDLEEQNCLMMYSKIHGFRMYQIFGQSIPILILKLSATIHQDTTQEPFQSDIKNLLFNESLANSTIAIDSLAKLTNISLTSPFLVTGCFNIILLLAQLFMFMPTFDKTDLTKRELRPVLALWTTYFFTLPLLVLNCAPRILNLSILFGVWRGLACGLTFLGALAIYTFSFFLLILVNYKEEWKKNKYPLIQSFFTSIFAPCIVMYPESSLLFNANLISTIPHLVLTSALLVVSINFPNQLFPKISVGAFDFLFPAFLIVPIFAWLLQSFSRRETQEILTNAISFKIIKFFAFTIILCALDEITDILSVMDYFR